jgi:hypothetical protein
MADGDRSSARVRRLEPMLADLGQLDAAVVCAHAP